jgi:uncharacterized coiled-coil protein SlyX
MEGDVFQLDERVVRLEEKHAFAERTSEELSAELVRAYEQIERLAKRLAILEARLGTLDADGQDAEAE